MKLEHYAKRLAAKTGTPVLEDIILKKRPVTDLPAECMPWTGRKSVPAPRTAIKIERDRGNQPYRAPVVQYPYGIIVVGGRRLYVHRYIYMLINEPRVEFRMENECGNTLCCNMMHWTIKVEEAQEVEVPHLDAFEAALTADWKMGDVNALLDQALSSYRLTSWEDVIANVLLEDCPHDMLVQALQEFRKPELLP